tara:strand:- start:821 stop:949 length:129 start_codon:yes stop_codon:yes gene_type:complete
MAASIIDLAPVLVSRKVGAVGIGKPFLSQFEAVITKLSRNMA